MATPATKASDEEVELRLRSTITPHSSTGYECFFSAAAKTGEFAYAQIARWDGANGSYTIIGQGGHNGSAYAIKTGDIVRCTAVGNKLPPTSTGSLSSGQRIPDTPQAHQGWASF
jgi:hypothetical protein